MRAGKWVSLFHFRVPSKMIKRGAVQVTAYQMKFSTSKSERGRKERNVGRNENCYDQ